MIGETTREVLQRLGAHTMPRYLKESAKLAWCFRGITLMAVVFATPPIQAQIAREHNRGTNNAIAILEGQSAEEARKRFEHGLATRILDIDRACHLTQDQRTKLELMGRGDIKRFLTR